MDVLREEVTDDMFDEAGLSFETLPLPDARVWVATLRSPCMEPRAFQISWKTLSVLFFTNAGP